MANPLAPLEELVSPEKRKVFYAFVALASLVLGIWQASQGDWVEFTGLLLAALGGATATANTHAPVDPDFWDDDDYEYVPTDEDPVEQH